MNGKKRLFRLFLYVTLALLVSTMQVQAMPRPQEPKRDMDVLRELYTGTQLRDTLHRETDEAPPAVEGEIAGTPPEWSRLAYEAYQGNWEIFMVDPSGGNTSRVTTQRGNDLHPAIERGAQRVLFASDRNGQFDILIANADGSQTQFLTTDPHDDVLPAWSPDGTRIAFQGYRTGNPEVFVMNADGSNQTQLTFAAGYDGEPTWSPDGTQIAFISSRTGRYQVWVMNADGSNLYQVTSGVTAGYPSWSPDGTKIAYTNDSNGDSWLEIWQTNPDGTSPQMILNSGYHQDRWGPSWSPDGKWISYTETTWTPYNGNWYWTTSVMRLHELATGGTASPIAGTEVWKITWGNADASAPWPCTVTAASPQRLSSFFVTMAAEDAGGSGIASFDLQARNSSAGTWRDIVTATPSAAAAYDGDPMDAYAELRCRARDIVRNTADWASAPIAVVPVDAAPPSSKVLPLPRWTRETSTPVSWYGQDASSSVAGYDVLVRDGTAGDWEVWQNNTVATSGVWNGVPGHTYYFRSQARDTVGHTELWEPTPQAVTTLYTYELTVTVTDNRGETGVVPSVHLDPAPLYTVTLPGMTGYRFFLNSAGTYTVTVAADGMGTLPATPVDVTSDLALTVSLVPADDRVSNGEFELGTLDGWSISGSGAQTDTSCLYSGQYGLFLNQATTGTTVLTQTLLVTTTMHEPTLSFLYNLPAGLVTGTFLVQVTGLSATTVLTTSSATDGWTLGWFDLTPYAGQEVTLTLALAEARGQLCVDQIALGSWPVPYVESVSPTSWPGYEAVTVTITGSNLLSPTVLLGDITIDNVTWVSSTRLIADVPAGLPAGEYDLYIVNAGGARTVLPEAVKVSWYQVMLPLVFNGAQSQFRPTAEWPTLGGDPARIGYNRYDAGASRYGWVWTASLPYESYAMDQVAAFDGVLVASNEASWNGAVVGLGAETGHELWRHEFTDKFSINPPSIGYGRVYFQEGNASDSYLFCLDLYNGTQYWQSPFSAQGESYLAPLIAEGSVFVNGGGGGGMYGYDAAGGAQKWFTELEQFDEWTPSYADGWIYSWVEGTFRAHSPATGGEVWSLPLEWSWHGYSMDTAPVITGQTAFVVAPGGLSAIDLSSRTRRWDRGGSYDDSLVATDGETVYALHEGIVEARQVTDGALLWSFTGDGALAHAPIIAGNYLYVASESNTYVVNRTTHEEEWTVGQGGWLTLANGFLYIAQPNAVIQAYRAQEP